MSNIPPQIEKPKPRRSRNSSFPWGFVLGSCFAVLATMMGGLLVLGFGSFWFYKKQLVQYTSEEARPLPIVDVTPEKLEQLESRVEAFQEKVELGPPPAPLVLYADDINALISNEEKLRGRVFVTIEDGLVQADVSLPTTGIPGGEGRYFNGSVSLDASLENDVLMVKLQQAEVNGQPIPEAFMRALRNQNLAKDVYKNPEFAEKLGQFEKLVVEGNCIILTPKHEMGAELVPEIPADAEGNSIDLKPTESRSARHQSSAAPLGM